MRLSELAALHPGQDPEILIESDGIPQTIGDADSGFFNHGGNVFPVIVLTPRSEDDEED